MEWVGVWCRQPPIWLESFGTIWEISAHTPSCFERSSWARVFLYFELHFPLQITPKCLDCEF